MNKEFRSDEFYGLKYKEVENAREAYLYLADLINREGNTVKARNEYTNEVMNASVLIKNPRDKFIPVNALNLPFIYQEVFDILNENQPRIIHSREMLKKTMGFEKNMFFFGNENRQGNSRWSLLRLMNVLKDDKHSRKAILSYGSRRPKLHYPCLIYAHFIIRDNKLHLSLETRATSITMAWPNDVILFSTIQETLLGWLQEYYPELEMGQLLYKTVSMHYFSDSEGKPTWSQDLIPFKYDDNDTFKLTHKEWVQEMGVLYHYIDEYNKASEFEDIDAGLITTFDDIKDSFKPDRSYFKTNYFYKWALMIYYNMLVKFGNIDSVDYLKLWEYGEI